MKNRNFRLLFHLMRVLITTHSKFFREALRFILHGEVNEVHVAENIDEFRELTRKNDYDLLLCDLECVQEHLHELRRWVKGNLKTARMIIFSFEPPQRIEEKLGRENVDRFINRPLNPQDVLEAVRVLRKRSAGRDRTVRYWTLTGGDGSVSEQVAG